jgi:dolichol-phosphate mannosyltransferase
MNEGCATACDVTVVVPTYCEAANLPVLVPRIMTALEQAQLCGEVVVVDDNSPDNTIAICQALVQQHPLRLFVRQHQRGLSSAVLHGIRQARGDVLVVMDADLSHPPEKLPELVAAVGSGAADFAIGSRYIAGGNTVAGWGLLRWLNSKAATLLALPLAAAHDPLSGFFALQRQTFLGHDALDPLGFKIGLELLVKCHCKRIKEVPITFHNRLHGRSKLSVKEQLNYLRHLLRLYEYRLTSRFSRPAA